MFLYIPKIVQKLFSLIAIQNYSITNVILKYNYVIIFIILYCFFLSEYKRNLFILILNRLIFFFFGLMFICISYMGMTFSFLYSKKQCHLIIRFRMVTLFLLKMKRRVLIYHIQFQLIFILLMMHINSYNTSLIIFLRF